MTILLHPGNVNMLELGGLLFAVLLVLWVLNSLFEWLKQKPWQKKPLSELPNTEEQQIPEQNNEHPPVQMKLSIKLS